MKREKFVKILKKVYNPKKTLICLVTKYFSLGMPKNLWKKAQAHKLKIKHRISLISLNNKVLKILRSVKLNKIIKMTNKVNYLKHAMTAKIVVLIFNFSYKILQKQ
jgi:hypothetical protein